jgi:hypothetical protein
MYFRMHLDRPKVRPTYQSAGKNRAISRGPAQRKAHMHVIFLASNIINVLACMVFESGGFLCVFVLFGHVCLVMHLHLVKIYIL